MVTSILVALTIGMAFLLNPQVEASHGPGTAKVNTKLGVVVQGPFEMTCTFLGRSKKVFIVYHQVSKEWEPKQSCNDVGGNESHHRVPADAGDPRLMLTAWYNDGQGGQQCDLKSWRDDPKGQSLSCQTPSGGTMTMTCTKGQCAKP